MLTEQVSGLLSRGDDGGALGQLVQQGIEVGLLHHLQVLVAGGVLRADDSAGGIIKGDALLLQEANDKLLAEALGLKVDKVITVGKPYESEDAPHVVREVGIEKVHAPALARRRKAAQHQQAGIRWQEWLKGMAFNRHNNETEKSEK